ncbi:unnamed protein product [Boreogadus saida]
MRWMSPRDGAEPVPSFLDQDLIQVSIIYSGNIRSVVSPLYPLRLCLPTLLLPLSSLLQTHNQEIHSVSSSIKPSLD